MARLGVSFVWIGFESQSRQSQFAKNDGIDPKALVKKLRDHGISVLASGILCMEHHTPENIHEDVDFLVGLNADFVQFMLFTPLPVTALYKRLKEKGLLPEYQRKIDFFIVDLEGKSLAPSIALCRKLRQAGHTAEYPLKPVNPRKQMQAADSAGAGYAIILDAQMESGYVKVRNMATGQEQRIKESELIQSDLLYRGPEN